MIHKNIKAVTANFECPNIILVNMQFSSPCPMAEYICMALFLEDTMYVVASSNVELVTPTDSTVQFTLQLTKELSAGDYTALFLHYPKPQTGENIYNLPDNGMEFRTIANYTFTKSSRNEVRMRRFKPWMEESYGVNWDCDFVRSWQQQIEAAESNPRPALNPETTKRQALSLLVEAMKQEITSRPTPRQRMDHLMHDINALEGLHEVKQTMERIYRMQLFNHERKRLALPELPISMPHFIFSGNPGTGKTTVARLIGDMMRRMGILTEGRVITHDRRTLLGQFIGETENKMNEVLNEAKGNVLFIDEAYALLTDRDDKKDYGRHVVEALLTAITSPHCSTVVVMAGYTDEMQQLLDSNPGLASRFPYHIHFEDFDNNNLLSIAYQILIESHLELTPEADTQLQQTIAEATSWRGDNFGNGRWINTFMRQGVIQAMANRAMEPSLSNSPDAPDANITDLTYITASDILCAANADNHIANVRSHAKPIRRVGFVAA